MNSEFMVYGIILIVVGMVFRVSNQQEGSEEWLFIGMGAIIVGLFLLSRGLFFALVA